MGKIITTFGQGGSGKTTFAVNLAKELSKRDQIVVILSADINCAGLQVFFHQKIEQNIGTYNALNDRTEMPDRFLHPVKEDSNIFLLSCPNEADEYLSPVLEAGQVESVIRKLALNSSFLIIDGTSDLMNGFTLMGLSMADYTAFCMKQTISSQLWHKINSKPVRELVNGEILYIINEHDFGTGLGEFTELCGISPSLVLPNVDNAAFLENQGKTIYEERSRQAEKYRKELRMFCDILLR